MNHKSKCTGAISIRIQRAIGELSKNVKTCSHTHAHRTHPPARKQASKHSGECTVYTLIPLISFCLALPLEIILNAVNGMKISKKKNNNSLIAMQYD